jgi:hypothetical protein
VYSTLSNFNSCVHDSRVAEINTLQDPDLLPHNHVRELIAQGRDSLGLIVDFCRRNGLEVFWSARMNDMHDNWYPQFMTRFKREHPELRLWRAGDYGRPGDGEVEPHMYATAMDYGRAEIRQRQFDTIIDVVERYDVDGIELDLMREPLYFRPNMEGRPVAAEHLALLTGFVQQVRARIDEVGQRRGRPILLSARVPNLLDRCRYIGLDVERWLAENLLDLIIPSLEFVPFTGDIRQLAALAHAHGVPVYPCIGGGADGIGGCSRGEGWAAATINALACGADGIATFNCFDPHFPAWNVIGDPASLREADKVYALEDIRSAMSTHVHAIDRTRLLPISLATATPTATCLPIHEDLAARSRRTVLSLFFVIDGNAFGDPVEVRLNGTPLRPELVIATQGCAPLAVGRNTYKAAVDVAALRCGENEVSITVGSGTPRVPVPVLCQLRLQVRGAV